MFCFCLGGVFNVVGNDSCVLYFVLHLYIKVVFVCLLVCLLIDWLIFPPCKILWIILKMDEGGTQTNEPKDNETDDVAQGLIANIWYKFYVLKKRRKRTRQYWELHKCNNSRIQEMRYKKQRKPITTISSWRQTEKQQNLKHLKKNFKTKKRKTTLWMQIGKVARAIMWI